MPPRFFNDEDEGSYYSDLLTVATMAIDNGKPAAPIFNVTQTEPTPGQFDFDVKVSTASMSVVQLKLQRLNPFSVWVDLATGNGRPEQALEFLLQASQGTEDVTISLRAFAYASDGTASDAAAYSFTIPGTA